MHYYSPRAYEYVRSVFNSNLPSSRTIRSWLSSIDCSPGFTENAFDVLREMADEAESRGKKLVVGLIFDEMKIRCQSLYDAATKEFLGHSNAGKINEAEIYSPLSNEALVLMVTGIDQFFKIPVAYFLSSGLNSDEKVMILDEAMCRLQKAGVVLGSMTFDGAAPNISAVKKLGADFNAEKPYFINPYDEKNNVYAVLDPPHMLKLIRNCMERLKVIYDKDSNEIKWEFIPKLIDLQIAHNINLCNKLTKTHAEFHNVKMNVKIAAQTISNSTATGIEFMDKELRSPEFANSMGTVNFMRIINNSFDISNAKAGHADEKYKRPLSIDTFNEFSAYFKVVSEYIRGLKTAEGKPLLNSKSNVPFLGFLNNMTSLMGIYTNHIAKNGIDQFYPFTLSQDHVETFFGCIRSMGGHNCNPNAQQFKSAYRKLLFQNEVSCSSAANCQKNLTKMLEVPFVKPKKNIPNQTELLVLSNFASDEFDPVFDYHDEGEYLTNEESDDAVTDQNDEYHIKVLNVHSKAYLASVLEKKVIRKIELKEKCVRCTNVFKENEKISDKFITFLSQTKTAGQPCKSTMKIISLAEDLLKKYESVNVSFQSILVYVVEKIIVFSLYELSEFDEQHDHKYAFTKCIIETFFEMRSSLVSQQITRIKHKTLIRHKNLKEVHRAGQ